MPFKATVTENTVKGGKKVKTRYQLVGEKDAKSGKLLVEHRRFKFLGLEGLDLKSAKGKVLVQRLEKQAATAIPGMLVDPKSGQFSGLVGLDAMIAKLSKAGFLKKEEVARFKKLMSSKPVLEAISREVSNLWLCWGGIWAGAAPSEINPTFKNITLDVIGEGYPFLVQIKGGVDPKDKGKLKLSFTAELSAKDSKARVKQFSKKLQMVSGGRRGKGLTAVSKKLSCKATLDAKTYMPLRVERFDRTVLHEKVEGKVTKTPVEEKHVYMFKW